VLIAATEITNGNAAKFFNVALALAISTTLISYLAIFPAAWKLRRDRPGHARPYSAPFLPLLTIVSMAAIVFCVVQILFPGLGDAWFGDAYLPTDWAQSERWVYLLTEAIPLVIFFLMSVAFWYAGRRHLAEEGELARKPESPSKV